MKLRIITIVISKINPSFTQTAPAREQNSFSQLGVGSVATNHRLTQVKLELEQFDLIDTNRGQRLIYQDFCLSASLL